MNFGIWSLSATWTPNAKIAKLLLYSLFYSALEIENKSFEKLEPKHHRNCFCKFFSRSKNAFTDHLQPLGGQARSGNEIKLLLLVWPKI